MKKVYKPIYFDIERGLSKQNDLFVTTGEFRKIRKGEWSVFCWEGEKAMYWNFDTDSEYEILRKMTWLEKIIYKLFEIV
jgi:hypothetical protein